MISINCVYGGFIYRQTSVSGFTFSEVCWLSIIEIYKYARYTLYQDDRT